MLARWSRLGLRQVHSSHVQKTFSSAQVSKITVGGCCFKLSCQCKVRGPPNANAQLYKVNWWLWRDTRKALPGPVDNTCCACPFICSMAMVTWFIGSLIRRSKWDRPDWKINVIPPFYFVLCRQAVSRYNKPTINLPWLIIKRQNYQNINTRTIQYNTIAMQYSVAEMRHLIKISFF